MKKLLPLSLMFVLTTGCSSLQSRNEHDVNKNIVFQKFESVSLSMDVYQPRKTQKPAPMVLMIHGGGWRSRSGDMSSECRDLARRGFVVFNMTYRLAPENPYPAALDDVRTALNYIRQNAKKFNGDSSKVFLWGYSAGAHLALLTGLKAEAGVQGIVAGAAPTDLASYPRSPLIKNFLGKKFKEDPELWKTASPVNHVSKDSPPVFLYHGDWDLLVGVDQMKKMEAQLKKNGVPVEAQTVSFMGHIGVYLFSQNAVDRGIKFLERLSN